MFVPSVRDSEVKGRAGNWNWWVVIPLLVVKPLEGILRRIGNTVPAVSALPETTVRKWE